MKQKSMQVIAGTFHEVLVASCVGAENINWAYRNTQSTKKMTIEEI